MNLPARVIKNALWSVWVPIAAITLNPPALRTSLQAKAVAVQQLYAAGGIRSNSANAIVTEFASFGAGNITLLEIAEVWVYLVDLFDTATIELQSGNTNVGLPGSPTSQPIANPTDAQVETQMESLLRPVAGATGNFLYIAK